MNCACGVVKLQRDNLYKVVFCRAHGGVSDCVFIDAERESGSWSEDNYGRAWPLDEAYNCASISGKRDDDWRIRYAVKTLLMSKVIKLEHQVKLMRIILT